MTIRLEIVGRRYAAAHVIRAIARRHDMTQVQARAVVREFIAEVRNLTWQQSRFFVPGLGVFSIKARRQRFVTAPNGAHRLVPAHHVMVFRALKRWRRK